MRRYDSATTATPRSRTLCGKRPRSVERTNADCHLPTSPFLLRFSQPAPHRVVAQPPPFNMRSFHIRACRFCLPRYRSCHHGIFALFVAGHAQPPATDYRCLLPFDIIMRFYSGSLTRTLTTLPCQRIQTPDKTPDIPRGFGDILAVAAVYYRRCC